jgi:Ca2+-binding EF-hand superfamily protein
MTIDIERLINEIDTDKNSTINYTEFKTLLSN